MKRFENKVVVITGASSGIGLATAREFARRGAHLVISARTEGPLLEAARELEATGTQVLAVTADVQHWPECQRLAEQTLARFNRADVLINNAGISMRALFADLDLEVIRRLMEVNFFGTVYGTKAFLPAIMASKGSIVAVSSIAGYRGLPARTGYSASKAAVQGFMESLRTELLDQGVHILVACPGFTESKIRERALTAFATPQGQSPLDEGKIMSAETVATHLADAIAGRRRDLILTRQGKLTVWLNKLAPGLMDRLVFNHFKKEEGSPL